MQKQQKRKEFLCLETGATPIRWVIKQRRINVLKYIILKDNNKLVKKVYVAQKEGPNIGDFVKLVEKDLKDFNITLTQVEGYDKNTPKKIIRNRATKAAFGNLKKNLSKQSILK